LSARAPPPPPPKPVRSRRVHLLARKVPSVSGRSPICALDPPLPIAPLEREADAGAPLTQRQCATLGGSVGGSYGPLAWA